MKHLENLKRNGCVILGILTENNILHIKLPCPMTGKQITADGLYINYLHVVDLVIESQFGMKEDKISLQTFKEIFGGKYSVEPFDVRWITKHGGAMNCVSWTTQQQPVKIKFLVYLNPDSSK